MEGVMVRRRGWKGYVRVWVDIAYAAYIPSL